MKIASVIVFLLGLAYTGALCSLSVTDIEYFFDTDPGPGNGTQIYDRNSVVLDELIDTAALAPGIHRLYIRARNDEGFWGLPQRASFHIPFAAPDFKEGIVTALEFFFDGDPGPGNGTQIYGRDMVEFDQAIDTASLSAGIHRLYVRAWDDEGKWSMPQSVSFLIPWTAASGVLVTGLEYFIDTDPGFGNGIQVAVTPGAVVSTSFPILVGPVTHGNHCLYIRARNSDGGWGFPACCQFSDGIPANLNISISNGLVTLFWEDLYGIDTYKVYSASLPEGVFGEETGGSFGTSSWTSPVSDPKRFYRVTSIYEE